MQPTENDFKLAQIFIHHSLNLKPKEKLLITTSDSGAFPLVKASYIEALKAGAFPMIDTQVDFLINRSFMGGFSYQFYKYANDWQLNHVPHELMEGKVKWADAYLRIYTLDNTKELSQIPPQKILLRNKLMRPYLDQIVDSDRWLLTYYPSPAMAQEAGISFDELLDFYYKACIVDYKKMEQELKTLEKVLDEGKRVKIIGRDTNLTFSIKGRLAKAAYGERNIPDGEVFLAPVHTTVEGSVYFEFPSQAYGTEVSDIYLEFKKGKITKAKAVKGQKALEQIIATDEGSHYLGELGIGANYNIKKGMNNTLFDEKIGGTVHLAVGHCYREKRGGALEGNIKSAIHWDIVKDMRKSGSMLLVDNKTVLKEGKFVI